MFLVRPATVDDAPTLLKLARMVHFINLPADPEIIRARIIHSRKSFAGEPDSPHDREFMFVLENTESGSVVGTSSVISCLSWPGHPHTYLQVRQRKLYSADLQTGHVHLTLKLGTDETGPTEVGGLVLGPSFRGHRERLGMVLSLIRFHFMGLHRDWFSDRIIAEMMGPLTPDSRNLFWEYVGRRFINLSFAEADLFCQRSKEFITALFPKEEIYASLLPAEARNIIGRVGAETEPARRLLESIGFRYRNHVDPFDGGPYLEAKIEDIELVKTTRTCPLAAPVAEYPEVGFVSVHHKADFRGVRTPCAETPDGVAVPPETAELLRAEAGETIGYTPVPALNRTPGGPRSGRRAPARKPPRRGAAVPPEAVS